MQCAMNAIGIGLRISFATDFASISDFYRPKNIQFGGKIEEVWEIYHLFSFPLR